MPTGPYPPAPASASSPEGSASPGSEASFYQSLDETTATFPNPNEPPENCKVMFPTTHLYNSIMNATYYSRIHTELPLALHPVLVDVLRFYPGMSESFITSHRHIILIYDTEPTAHAQHYHAACEMLRSQKIAWDAERCVFSKPTSKEVGFLIRRVDAQRTPGLMLVDVGEGGG